MSDDPGRALGALYPSTIKPDATAATPATSPASVAPKASTGTTKPVATSPATAAPAPAAQSGKGTWQAPGAAPPGTAATAAPGTTPQPAKTAQPDPPRDPAAAIYGSPMRDMQEAVAATPIPDDAAEHFDMGEAGKQARADVRSAFLTAGASKEETAELWGIAVAAARPDARITTADEAERELREAWKGNYEARLASVRAFFKGVAQKHPAVADEVRKLGLDNSAAFLKALHRAAARRGR